MTTKGQRQTQWGFKDVVKNPKLWRKTLQAQKSADRTFARKKWDNSQLLSAINHYIFDTANSDEAIAEGEALESLGARVHSTILQILSDRSHRAKLVRSTRKDILPEAPFSRACKLLGDMPPIEAAALVAPFIRHKNEEIRKDAALVLGKIGTPEVVAPLRRAVTDRDEYVRSYGLMGLRWAIKNDRLSNKCAAALFGDVARLVRAGRNLDSAVRLLLEMDQASAIKLFLSDRMFTPESRPLPDILKALADRRIRLPRVKLLALISELEQGEMNYLTQKALGESLRLLGQHKRARDRAFLEARTASPEPKVARGAAAGLIASVSLEGFDQRMREQETRHGFSSLTQPQQHYAAVFMYDAEVINGGFLQYFFNSSGNDWRYAVAGLEAMGFVERLALFREALGKFGKKGPPQNRKRRQEQLAKLTRTNDNLFSPLDDRYYKSTEVVEVIMKQYVLKNADAFK